MSLFIWILRIKCSFYESISIMFLNRSWRVRALRLDPRITADAFAPSKLDKWWKSPYSLHLSAYTVTEPYRIWRLRMLIHRRGRLADDSKLKQRHAIRVKRTSCTIPRSCWFVFSRVNLFLRQNRPSRTENAWQSVHLEMLEMLTRNGEP